MIILASGSPRRARLLELAGIDFEVRRPDIDESPMAGESPTSYVARLSKQKALAVAAGGARRAVVLAADTTVDLDGEILEKPIDAAEARRMLRALRGRAHQTHTGVTVISPHGTDTIVVTTTVVFADVADETIDWYVGTGEPLDKAGAYAIQERGAALVARVDGSVTNVVGLPLAETLAMVRLALSTPGC